MATVVVGLSGGVDSSVAAYLLKEQGHNVIGLFMKNWHDDSVTISDECPWLEDSHDAMLVAQALNIPFQTVDFSQQYRERIVDYMFDEYRAGRTPNPDILCNREVKFDLFWDVARSLGADYVATGHYCRKEEVQTAGGTSYNLLAGKDSNKDQSYFLCQVSQEQLATALFPIGELDKPEVRAIAEAQDLVTAGKKDSQGLCFIGKVRLPDFLQQQLKPKVGDIIEIPVDAAIYQNHAFAKVATPELAHAIDDLADYELQATASENTATQLQLHAKAFQYAPEMGKVLGQHQGAHYFTVGQRKGLAVGGTAEPLFVIATDTDTNTVYTGQTKMHPGLLRDTLLVNTNDIHWIRPDLELEVGESARYDARIRYRQPLCGATLTRLSDGLYVQFDEPQTAIAAGQFVAWYDGEACIGSGVIAE